VQVEQDMNVIGDVVHFDEVAFLFFEDPLSIGVQGGVGSWRQQGCAALGAEHEMDENFG
jgi:hypothetical protein